MTLEELSDFQKRLLVKFKPDNGRLKEILSRPQQIVETTHLLENLADWPTTDEEVVEKELEKIKSDPEYSSYEALRNATNGEFNPLVENGLLTEFRTQPLQLHDGIQAVFHPTPAGIRKIHNEIEEYEYSTTTSVTLSVKANDFQRVTGIICRNTSGSVRIPSYIPCLAKTDTVSSMKVRAPLGKKFVVHTYYGRREGHKPASAHEVIGLVSKGTDNVLQNLEQKHPVAEDAHIDLRHDTEEPKYIVESHMTLSSPDDSPANICIDFNNDFNVDRLAMPSHVPYQGNFGVEYSMKAPEGKMLVLQLFYKSEDDDVPHAKGLGVVDEEIADKYDTDSIIKSEELFQELEQYQR